MSAAELLSIELKNRSFESRDEHKKWNKNKLLTNLHNTTITRNLLKNCP